MLLRMQSAVHRWRISRQLGLLQPSLLVHCPHLTQLTLLMHHLATKALSSSNSKSSRSSSTTQGSLHVSRTCRLAVGLVAAGGASACASRSALHLLVRKRTTCRQHLPSWRQRQAMRRHWRLQQRKARPCIAPLLMQPNCNKHQAHQLRQYLMQPMATTMQGCRVQRQSRTWLSQRAMQKVLTPMKARSCVLTMSSLQQRPLLPRQSCATCKKHKDQQPCCRCVCLTTAQTALRALCLLLLLTSKSRLCTLPLKHKQKCSPTHKLRLAMVDAVPVHGIRHLQGSMMICKVGLQPCLNSLSQAMRQHQHRMLVARALP